MEWIAGSCPAMTKKTGRGGERWPQSEARPHLLSVRGGTLDDPEIAKPQMTIWTSSAPSWAPIDPHIPQEKKQPAPPAMPSKG